MQTDPFLFVSHVREDHDAAMEVVAGLERRGVSCWVAPRDVHPGRSFDEEIAAALENCAAMLLIFSDRCNDNPYIRREVTVAGEIGKAIVPLRIEDARPRKALLVRLSDLHWIDGSVSREQGIDEVVRIFAPGKDAARLEPNGISPARAVEEEAPTAPPIASTHEPVGAGGEHPGGHAIGVRAVEGVPTWEEPTGRARADRPRWSLRKVLIVVAVAVGLLGSAVFIMITRQSSEIAETSEVHAQENLQALLDRGRAYYDKKDYDGAIAELTKALNLDPNSRLGLIGRGASYLAKKDYGHAIADYSKLIRLEPKDVSWFYLRGLCYLLDDNLDAAIADFSAAISLNPKHAEALYYRGLAKQTKGDEKGGKADIAAAKAIKPDVDK